MPLFFIKRPIFAWVIALVTMLSGGWALTTLPVAQYPDIAPTTISISATYSGATADAVRNSVTSVIEDGLTGLDGLLYMESSSTRGSSSISLVFDESIGAIDAQNDVQTRVNQVEAQLPDTVQTSGVSVTRSTSSILMVGALESSTSDYDSAKLGYILDGMVKDPILRTEGVGSLNIFGSGYAMRIWLDPLALVRYQLTPSDVVSAVEVQNTTVSVGSLGDQPTVDGQQITATITAQSQLTEAAEFERILLKTEEGGGAVFLGDVARIEIGQEDYSSGSRFNGKPSAGFAVSLATGANALDTAAAVKKTVDRLKAALPAGVDLAYAYDTSPFVQLSIDQVYRTLVEAVVLVILVLLVFLQSWRATLVPLIAVPVVLLGTFTVLSLFGYTINTLTMFAMVLAIGLLVDDAIVVVENVERLMEEQGLSARTATRRSMGQITSALVGIAVVLCAVFLPMAFFGGSTGVIYRQFSVTMIAAMLLSLAVAIILSPAMCASLLKPKVGETRIPPLRWFNHGFDWATDWYTAAVRRSLKRPVLMIVVLGVVLAGAWFVSQRMTSSFLPTEDQGMLMTMVSLDNSATLVQTQDVVTQVEKLLLKDEAVATTFSALGFGFNGSGQNEALIFLKLRPFEERTDPSLAAGAVAARANAAVRSIRNAQVVVMQPPAIMGMGTSGGFTMYLVDLAGNGRDALAAAAEKLVALAQGDAQLMGVRTSGAEEESAMRILIDQQKAQSLGVSLSDLNTTLSVIFAGSDVNDFVLAGDLRPVIVQGAAAYRMRPEDVETWYIRNETGEMVPLSALITTEWGSVPPRLTGFDATNAIKIEGSAGPNVSSGAAMEAMEALTASLPGGYGASWTGLSYQERQSGDQAPMLYALSAVIDFLALAARYESWSIPRAVMLVVPV
ncbi:MAG: efflux RND transporter permease subunit, partial [Rhodospirillum sp.]|nr:efflux RND transporter permease subunit [Rhodospirillum sp.]